MILWQQRMMRAPSLLMGAMEESVIGYEMIQHDIVATEDDACPVAADGSNGGVGHRV